MKTRGHRSSEYRSLRTCFVAGFLLAGWGIYQEADLSALALLIPAVSSPLMFYAGGRSYVKGRQGEDD